MYIIDSAVRRESRGRTCTALFAVLLLILTMVPGRAWAAPVDDQQAVTAIPADEFTFDDIDYWVGQGTERAAFVVQWNDEGSPTNLVWGYRWDGEASGEDMLRTIAREDPRFFALVLSGSGFGAALGGIGFDTNGDGDIALYLDGDASNPFYPDDGIIEASGYSFDDFTAADESDRWASGWYENGYWSYWVRDGLDAEFDYSGVGMTGRVLTDGAWDYWSFTSLSQWPGDITLGEEFTPVQPPEPFSFIDVPEGMQFYEDIMWLADQGITTGWLLEDGTREYRPLSPIHRDAMTAYLYRMAGSPEFTAPEESPFSDVATDSEFYTEIAWLAAQGITTGWPDGTFRPLEDVNRDAMAAFLYRFAGSPEFVPPAASAFNDVPVTGQFYREIAWLADRGISTGWPDGSFRPLQPVARDAMAAFLHRLG